MTHSAPTCAVGPCADPREPDSDYCVKHGPQNVSARSKRQSERAAARIRGKGSDQIVCPHCQHRGSVTTRRVKVKRGVSGGKATGAVLTAGISLLATGLSRKEQMTEAKCGKCKSVWRF